MNEIVKSLDIIGIKRLLGLWQSTISLLEHVLNSFKNVLGSSYRHAEKWPERNVNSSAH